MFTIDSSMQPTVRVDCIKEGGSWCASIFKRMVLIYGYMVTELGGKGGVGWRVYTKCCLRRRDYGYGILKRSAIA